MGGPIIIPVPAPPASTSDYADVLPRTKLTPTEWARIMGINPIHFNQCYLPNQELNSTCQAAFFQYDWQDSERVSRQQLSDAIRQAEENIEAYLGFHLLPSWDYDEWHGIMSRPYRPEFFNISQTDVRGLPTGVQCDWGYIITGGVEGKVLASAGEAIVWSDENGDGVDETGTVSVAGLGSDVLADELEAYYPDKDGSDAWQIRPIKVNLVAGVATITFARELTLLQSKLEDISDPRGQDYTVDANFLTEVDVYRRYNDPSVQARLIWEAQVGCGCSGGCDACSYAIQTACLLPRYDTRLGFVAFHAGTWDTDHFTDDALALQREPDAIRLFYKSGWRDMKSPVRDTRMDRDLAYIVAIYAASMLDRKVCDCKGISDGILRWQKDLAFAGGATEISKENATNYVLDCPFGTTRGAVEAWRRLSRPNTQKARIGRAVIA